MIKILILFAFCLIIYNLAKALFNLVSSKGSSKKLLKALALRVTFSILLFCIILIAHFAGFIDPTGISLPDQ
jgi:hypothetical protein